MRSAGVFVVASLATTLSAAEIGHELPDFTSSIDKNATAAREYRGEIPTAFWDLRLGVDVIRSGLPLPWPHAAVAVSAATKRYYWSESSLLVNPPGSTYTPFRSKAPEDRLEYEVRINQSIWTPFPWDAQLELSATACDRSVEVQRAGVTTTYNDNFLVDDPRALLLLPVWQGRYVGVLVGGGVQAGLGDEKDWIHAHDGTGWVATGRWSGVLPIIPCSSFSISANYVRVPNASNNIYTAPGNVTVDRIYDAWEGGANAWWRPWTHVALGAMCSIERHRYKDNKTSTGITVSEERVVTSNLGPLLRASWARSNLTLGVTTDVLSNENQARAWQVLASLEVGAW